MKRLLLCLVIVGLFAGLAVAHIPSGPHKARFLRDTPIGLLNPGAGQDNFVYVYDFALDSMILEAQAGGGGGGSDTSLFLSEAVGSGTRTVFWSNDTLFFKNGDDTMFAITDNGLQTRFLEMDNTSGFEFTDGISMLYNNVANVAKINVDSIRGVGIGNVLMKDELRLFVDNADSAVMSKKYIDDQVAGGGFWDTASTDDTLYWAPDVDTIMMFVDLGTITVLNSYDNTAGFRIVDDVDMNDNRLSNVRAIFADSLVRIVPSADLFIIGGTSGDIKVEEPIGTLRWTFSDNRMTGEANAAIVLDSLIPISGSIGLEGDLKLTANLTINADDGAADAIITFMNPTTDGILSYSNGGQRFVMDAVLQVDSALRIVDPDVSDGEILKLEFYDSTGAVEFLGWDPTPGIDRFNLTDDLTIAGALWINANILRIKSSGGDGDQFIYFYDNGSSLGRSLKWDLADDRFEFDTTLHVAASILTTENLTLNSDDGGVDAIITFTNPTTDGLLAYDDGQQRFTLNKGLVVSGVVITDTIQSPLQALRAIVFLADTLRSNVTGNFFGSPTIPWAIIHTDEVRLNPGGDNRYGRLYAFNSGSPTGGEFRFDSVNNYWVTDEPLRTNANIQAGTDVFVNNGGGAVLGNFFSFNAGINQGLAITGDSLDDRWEFNSDILVTGDIKATGDVYLNQDGSSATGVLFAFEAGSPTGAAWQFDTVQNFWTTSQSLRSGSSVLAKAAVYTNFGGFAASGSFFSFNAGANSGASLVFDTVENDWTFSNRLDVNSDIRSTNNLLMNLDGAASAGTIFTFEAGSQTGASLSYDTIANDWTFSHLVEVAGLRMGSAYTFPTSDGTANQILKTDGAGVLTFQADDGAGGGTADSMSVDTDGDGTIDDYLYSTAAGAFNIKKGTNITLTVLEDTLTIASTGGGLWATLGTADTIVYVGVGNDTIIEFADSSTFTTIRTVNTTFLFYNNIEMATGIELNMSGETILMIGGDIEMATGDINGGGTITSAFVNVEVQLELEGITVDGLEQVIKTANVTGADKTFIFPNDEMVAGDILVASDVSDLAYLNLATTEILIGDGAGIPTAAALSKDVTMDNAGLVTLDTTASTVTTYVENAIFDSLIPYSEITNVVLRDGSQALTGDWAAGAFDITGLAGLGLVGGSVTATRILHSTVTGSSQWLAQSTGVDAGVDIGAQNDAQQWTLRLQGSTDNWQFRNETGAHVPLTITSGATTGAVVVTDTLRSGADGVASLGASNLTWKALYVNDIFADANLTINADDGAADATITFMNPTDDGIIRYDNGQQRFEFDRNVQGNGYFAAFGDLYINNDGLGSATGSIFAFDAGSTTGAFLTFDSTDANTDWTFSHLVEVPGLRVGSAYTFPTSDGSANQILKTDGAGVLTFQADAGAGLTNWSEGNDNDTSLWTPIDGNTVAGFTSDLTMQGNDITGVGAAFLTDSVVINLPAGSRLQDGLVINSNDGGSIRLINNTSTANAMAPGLFGAATHPTAAGLVVQGQPSIDDGSAAAAVHIRAKDPDDSSPIDAGDVFEVLNWQTELFSIDFNGVIQFNNAYTFPTSDGSANAFLQTNGAGALTFQAVDLSASDVTGLLPESNIDISNTGVIGNVIYKASGDQFTYLTPNGSAGTFLRSGGVGVAPTWATPSGSGDVTKVGTPVDNQVGVWTGDGTLEGDIDLTFDGDNLAVDGAVNALTFEIEGTADGFEHIITAVDPTADRTFTFPNDEVAAGDVLVGSGAGTMVYIPMPNAQILVGLGFTTPAAKAVGGDLTMIATGAFTIIDDVIDTSNIDYSMTLAGNPPMAANQVFFASTGIIFEGATDNTLEGLLTTEDISGVDKTWTLQNNSGTIYQSNGNLDVAVADGGTGQSSLTDGGILLGSGAADITVTARPTIAQLLIGSTSGDPVLAQLGEGEGIDITQADGAITVLGEDATSSNKGIATFHTDNFAVSGGDVTIKDGGIISEEILEDDLRFNDMDFFVSFSVGTLAGKDAWFTNVEGLGGVLFEGSADAFELVLTVVDPTTDKIITLPNKAGDVALIQDFNTANFVQATGDIQIKSGGVNTDEILDGTINEADLDITNAGNDNDILSKNDAGGNYTWVAPGGGGGNTFKVGVADVFAVQDSVNFTANGDISFALNTTADVDEITASYVAGSIVNADVNASAGIVYTKLTFDNNIDSLDLGSNSVGDVELDLGFANAQQIGIEDMDNSNDWSTLYWGASGLPITVDLPTSGLVWKSNGVASAPTWQTDETGGSPAENSIDTLELATANIAVDGDIMTFQAGNTIQFQTAAELELFSSTTTGDVLIVIDIAVIGEGKIDSLMLNEFQIGEWLGDTLEPMLEGGTNVGITITYDDANSNFDFVVGGLLNAQMANDAMSTDKLINDASDDGFVDVAAGGTGRGTFVIGELILGNGTGDLVGTGVLGNNVIMIGDGTTTPGFNVMTGDGQLLAGGAFTIGADKLEFGMVDNSIDIGGQPAMAAGEAWFGTTGIIWEGTTDDLIEGLLTWPVTSSDKTITLPDATGTVELEGHTHAGGSGGDLDDNTITMQDDMNTFTKAQLETQTTDVANFAEADGDVYSGAHTFTSATGLLLPTGSPNVEGELHWGAALNSIQGYDGTNEATLAAMRKTMSFVIIDPATTHDFPMMQVPQQWTLISISAICIGGTDVFGQLQNYNSTAGSPANTMSSDLQITTSETTSSTWSDATITAGEWIGWKTTTVNGSVASLSFTLEYEIR